MRKILVVDDEADLAHLYRLVLEMSGYEVRAATSGKEALRLLREDIPHLVLLDVMMPGMDGIEVCHQIRKGDIPSDRQPVIIMYTANDSAENRMSSHAAGANELVSKDVPVEKLTAKINGYLLAAAPT